MSDGTQTTPAEAPLARDRADEMLADWGRGLRQVDIARKYGVSQGYVSRLIGMSSEPTAAEWKARCLLAQSLISHRLDTSNPDVAAVLAVLRGDLSLAGVA